MVSAMVRMAVEDVMSYLVAPHSTGCTCARGERQQPSGEGIPQRGVKAVTIRKRSSSKRR
jgi:hypothetical protein